MNNGAAAIVVGRVIQVLLGLVSVRVMTSLLSPAEVGNYYLIFSLLSFFAFAFLNPVGMYLNRKTHKWLDDRTIYNNLLLFCLYLLTTALFTYIFVYFIRTYTGLGSAIATPELTAAFIAVALVASTWNQVIVPLFNMMGQRKTFVFFSIMTVVLGLVFSVVAVRNLTASAVVWLSGLLLSQAVVALVAFIRFRTIVSGGVDFHSIRSTATGENLTNVMRFVLPLALTALMIWTQNQSYRMILEQKAGLELLGMLGLGFGISSNIAAAVESLQQQFCLPLFYRDITGAGHDARAAAWNRMAQVTFPVYISLAIMVSCIAPFLVNILASGRFSDAWIYVAFGAWIELCRMTTVVLSSVAHAEMQTRHLVKAYVIGGGLAVAGVWLVAGHPLARLLVPLSLIMSGVLSTGVMYLEMRKLIPAKVGIRNIRRSILLSAPFALALPIAGHAGNAAVSFAVLAVAGTYFLAIHYRIAKPFWEKGTENE